MDYIRLRETTKPANLARSIYALSSGVGRGLRETAAAAILAANPTLAELRTIPPGTLVAVPSLAGLSLLLAPEDRGPIFARLDELGAEVENAARAAKERAISETEQAKEAAKILRAPDLPERFKELGRLAAEATRRAEASEKEIRRAASESQERAKHAEAALKVMKADLESMRKRLRGR
jgi:hypothetical protein